MLSIFSCVCWQRDMFLASLCLLVSLCPSLLPSSLSIYQTSSFWTQPLCFPYVCLFAFLFSSQWNTALVCRSQYFPVTIIPPFFFQKNICCRFVDTNCPLSVWLLLTLISSSKLSQPPGPDPWGTLWLVSLALSPVIFFLPMSLVLSLLLNIILFIFSLFSSIVNIFTSSHISLLWVEIAIFTSIFFPHCSEDLTS